MMHTNDVILQVWVHLLFSRGSSLGKELLYRYLIQKIQHCFEMKEQSNNPDGEMPYCSLGNPTDIAMVDIG